MTLEDALKIANSSINRLGTTYKPDSFSIDEAIEALSKEIRECWFVWITGENALEILKQNKSKKASE